MYWNDLDPTADHRSPGHAGTMAPLARTCPVHNKACQIVETLSCVGMRDSHLLSGDRERSLVQWFRRGKSCRSLCSFSLTTATIWMTIEDNSHIWPTESSARTLIDRKSFAA
jgi:hypothetical protein